MTTAFPVRGLDPDVVRRLDAAAAAEGTSRNAYVVRVLTEHSVQHRPVVTVEAFRRAVELAADLGDGDVMRAAWSRPEP